jgi:FkbM family methyltransferase
MGNTKLIEFLHKLKKAGLKYKNVFDIGSYRGDLSIAMQDSYFANCVFYLCDAGYGFEQNVNIINELGKRFTLVSLVFFDVSGLKMPLYMINYGPIITGTLKYQDTKEYYLNNKDLPMVDYIVRVETITLDDHIINTCDRLAYPEFISLDVDGSELEVLDGIKIFFDEVKLIYLTIPVGKFNLDTKTSSAYFEYMRKRKFVPVGVFDQVIYEDSLTHIKVLFLRNDIKEKYLNENKFYNPLKAK